MSAPAAKNKFPLRFSIGFSIVLLISYFPGLIGLPQVNGVFYHSEDVWADHLFQSHRDSLPTGDPRIIVAAVDDDTGKVYHFPLPRDVYARLLDKLKEYGVKTAIFDVTFPEPRENDQLIIDATKRFGKAIHLFTTALKYTPIGRQYVVEMPIPGIAKAAEGLGFPNVDRVLDSDGHIRRFIFFDARGRDPRNEDRIAPSVDAVALSSYLDKPMEEVQRQWGDPPDRMMLLNFRPPQNWPKHPTRDLRSQGKQVKVEDLVEVRSPYQTISALDLLQGTLSPEQRRSLKGSIVIMGSTALGYYDHYPSPFNPEAPGLELHCNVLDNAMHGDFLRMLGRQWIILAMLVFIWLPMLLQGFAPVVGAGVTAAVFVAWYFFVDWQFGRSVRVDFVGPQTALVLSFLVQTVNRVLKEGAEKRAIQQTFGRFVSPEVVKDLAENPDKATIGAQEKEMTVFFLDIAHFTTISEKVGNNIFEFLNVYLSGLTEVVEQGQQGTVDKYIGDCIMAFWNAPLDQQDHRARACLAAIKCQEVMERLNKTHKFPFELPEKPEARIGLNSGPMKVGFTGSKQKLQYTVIGDEVNLGSRLEGANKFFGSKIMASESTYAGAKDAVEGRELGRVRVVGKAVPIRVYELLAEKGRLSEEWKKALPEYERGLACFNKRDYAQAVLHFQEVVKIFPKDGPGNLYLNASRDYSAIPPQDDWDGVFNLTAK